MKDYRSLTYKQLQEEAKERGIRANQRKEDLIKQLEELSVPQQEASTKEEDSWSTVLNSDRKTVSKRENYIPNYEVSPRMLKWARDLYKLHKLDDSALDSMNYIEIRAEIDRLRALPRPISDEQRKAILKQVEEIKEFASSPFIPEELKGYQNLSVPEDLLDSLTGGYEGTASLFMDKLFEIKNSLRPYRPASEAQLEMVRDWFFCPDVPFEKYGVVKKNNGVLLTPSQFKEELYNKISGTEMSQLIEEYMPIARTWQRTRAKQWQIDEIRKLEMRLAGLQVHNKFDWQFDPKTGEMKKVYIDTPESVFNPTGYKHTPDEHLMMMSVDEATEFIEQLKIELSRPMQSSLDYSNNQILFNDKMQALAQKEKTKEVDARVKESKLLENFTYKLDSLLMFEHDELRNKINELFIRNNGRLQDVREMLVESIDLALSTKAISFDNLVDLTQDSDVLTSIISAEYPVEYDQAMYGKHSEEQEAKFIENLMKAKVDEGKAQITDFLNSFLK